MTVNLFADANILLQFYASCRLSFAQGHTLRRETTCDESRNRRHRQKLWNCETTQQLQVLCSFA